MFNFQNSYTVTHIIPKLGIRIEVVSISIVLISDALLFGEYSHQDLWQNVKVHRAILS